jgi:TolB-like protein
MHGLEVHVSVVDRGRLSGEAVHLGVDVDDRKRARFCGVEISGWPDRSALARRVARIAAGSCEVAMSDFLPPTERARLDELRRRDPFVRDVFQQVERILQSRRFGRVQRRAKDFLFWIVAKALLGHADHIKETTIALSVFDESADFNPVESSKVRVAGADLRQRLVDYMQHEGHSDLIQIGIPLNTYVPEIRDRRIAVAIAEFENWHPDARHAHLSSAISGELAHRLENAGLRAGSSEALRIGSHLHSYTLRGSFESRDEILRMNVSLADPTTGRILCSQSFEGPRDDMIKLTRTVADALLAALPSLHPPAGVLMPSRKHPRAGRV